MTNYFNPRELVIPGQLLSDDARKAGKLTYVLAGKVYSAVAGFAVERDGKIEVIAIKGPYKPSIGDSVVGIVVDIKPSYAEVDLGGYIVGTLRLPEKRRRSSYIPTVGDVIYTTVKYSGVRGVILDNEEELKKIDKGLLVWINPVKIPRLIGKRGSMLNLIKKETGCQLYVGRNGIIALVGPDSRSEFIAASAIELIDREAHSKGLDDKVTYHIRKQILSEGDDDGTG